jgi:hypothetical protein
VRRAALLAAALVAAAAGCSGERTEIVLIIDQAGLKLGQDIDTLHIQIAQDSESTPFFNLPFILCGTLPTTTCVNLPLSATLIPGPMLPDDNVRLQVDAKLGGDDGRLRISDVADFRFTKGESLRLELVLTANCLDMLSCAESEAACYDGRCYNPMPEPAGADLSVPVDLAPPHDFAGVDFAGVDLTCVPLCPAGYCGLDQNNCNVACQCTAQFEACGNTQACQPCGLDDQACCPTSQSPRCRTGNRACSSTGNGGTCVACLGPGDLCSTGGQPCCSGTFCSGGACLACGAQGAMCCPGSMCDTGLGCSGGTSCQPCGASMQPCCGSGPPCNSSPPLACVGATLKCEPCGELNDPCCSGGCNHPTLACDNGSCATCGLAQGEPCCSGNTCSTGFACDNTTHCTTCGQSQGSPCCPDSSCSGALVCTGPPNSSTGFASPGTCEPPSMDMAMDMDMSLPDDLSQPSDLRDAGDMTFCGAIGLPCCAGSCPTSGTPCFDPTCMCEVTCSVGGPDMPPLCPATQGMPCCTQAPFCALGYSCCNVGPCVGPKNGSVGSDTCYQ